MLSLLKKESRLAIALAGLCLVYSGFVQPLFAQEREVVDEIVAIVGSEIVLKSDVDGLVFGLMQQQQDVEYSDDIWADALAQIVDQHVLTIHAERDTTLEVTDDQVEQALDQRIQQLTRQVGSTSRIEELYGKSMVQIRAEFRDQFKDRLLAERLQGTKLSAIKITPTEVHDWFAQFPTDSLPELPEMVRVAHIVRYPKPTPEAEAEALEIVTAIRDSILTGNTTLEEMATIFSEDPGSASQGGRFELMKLSDLVPEFAAVASRIEINDLSAPFKSPFGYHILRVNERRGDQVDFNHILISIDESKADPTEALRHLKVVRDSILTNKIPFEIMARRHSEEQLSSEMGGRVLDPNSGRRDLVLDALGPTWKDSIDTLEIGQLGMPSEVQLLDGSRAYHIIELQKKAPPHRIDISTDYQRIEELALQDKQGREMRKWLDMLRGEVYIKYRGKAEEIMTNATGSANNITQQRN